MNDNKTQNYLVQTLEDAFKSHPAEAIDAAIGFLVAHKKVRELELKTITSREEYQLLHLRQVAALTRQDDVAKAFGRAIVPDCATMVEKDQLNGEHETKFIVLVVRPYSDNAGY